MLNAEIEEGAASTVLVHLANISYRVGRTINFDSKNLHLHWRFGSQQALDPRIPQAVRGAGKGLAQAGVIWYRIARLTAKAP